MNIALKPEEVLDLFESLVLSGQDVQSDLRSKVRSTILYALEKHNEELNAVKYHTWYEQEERKIQSLSEKNQTLVGGLRPRTNKSKTRG
jgi:hypothetical protein